jgi:hypothetical protein
MRIRLPKTPALITLIEGGDFAVVRLSSPDDRAGSPVDMEITDTIIKRESIEKVGPTYPVQYSESSAFSQYNSSMLPHIVSKMMEWASEFKPDYLCLVQGDWDLRGSDRMLFDLYYKKR